MQTDDKDILGLHTIVPEPIICFDPSASLTNSPFESGEYFIKSLYEPAMCRDAPESISHGLSL